MEKAVLHSISQRLLARYFAGLLAISGVVSAVVHPLPNLTDMSTIHRAEITAVCLLGAVVIWLAPWDRWPRASLYSLPILGMGVKMWANLHGGLGPYSYSIHFVLIYVWMGVALPRGAPLALAPVLAIVYSVPLMTQGDPRQMASIAMVLPICVVIGESVAWISSRLRDAEVVDGKRMQRTQWLVQASVELARQRASQGVADSLAALANELPSAAGAAVLTPGENRQLEVVASDRWSGSLPERFDLSEEPVLIRAMRSGEILGSGDDDCAALAERLQVPRLGIAPLIGGVRCTGVVFLARRASALPLDEFNQNLVKTLSVQAGLAFERIQLSDRLREASLHDELTGVGNRRKANDRLQRIIPGDAIVMIDLDHFKRVNDTRGHAAGDEILRGLTHFLADAMRGTDDIYRMGGEEFIVVLEDAGEGAAVAAERLCAGWRFREPVTTFSAGVAMHGANASGADTLARADAALYEAKRAGRDRVVAAR
jgi:diguanylate cyclase (GGDEF)-like protein